MITQDDMPQLENALSVLKMQAPLTSVECLRLSQYLFYDGQQDLSYQIDMMETKAVNILLIREA